MRVNGKEIDENIVNLMEGEIDCGQPFTLDSVRGIGMSVGLPFGDADRAADRIITRRKRRGEIAAVGETRYGHIWQLAKEE
jgi:hypothetical protein